MNKIMMILVVGLFLSGCGNAEDETIIQYEYDTWCTVETTDKRAKFIVECIANANPKSDEEPEDWIRSCQYMGEDTFCEKKEIKVTLFRAGGSNTFWKITNKELVIKQEK